MQTLTKRSEIAQAYTWNLESIFATDADWKREYQALAKRIPELETLQGTLEQSGKTLFTVLQARDEVFERLEKLYVYSSMRKDEDTTNSTYHGMQDQAMQVYVHATTAISFIEPEILALPQAKLDQFVQDHPELKLYEHQLHDISRNRPHVRSAEVEAVLAAAGE
ncbi:MAG: oligoendopeptidase F, partial [Ktedonobacteraceae bacterium]